MSDAPPQIPEAGSSRKSTIIFTAFVTLAVVFVLEKLLVLVPDPAYQSRAKRSEALLAAQEQRSKGYQEHYESVREDHKRYEALLSRQEQDIERFEKILGTWEQQQKAYQAYLDSLKHPQ
jgi:hypothetical protein